MDKTHVVSLHASFEGLVQVFPDTGTEFWCARDLQMLLGYAKWENFARVIDRAITSCESAGLDPKDHFLSIRKMVDLGSGITNFNVKQNDLRTESRIAAAHVKNNQEVRRLLVDRGIVPEALPPDEDVQKVERRLKSEQRKALRKI